MRLYIEVVDTNQLVELSKMIDIINDTIGPHKLFWSNQTKLVAVLEPETLIGDIQTCCKMLYKLKDVSSCYIVV
jgi:hypothetical protein